jgi:hypothetical protein
VLRQTSEELSMDAQAGVALNRPLVITGGTLIVVGIVLFFVVMGATPADDFTPGTAQLDPSAADDPSRGWAIVAGLVFAAGLAMVGIGMNRWRQRRARQV